MRKKEGGVKMSLKDNKYNPTKNILYSIHVSKPNLACEFGVWKQILTKLKY
jgi:hypothetical protein